MPGPATYARDAHAASVARDALDRAVTAVEAAAEASRDALAALISLWPTAAWQAAGCHSPRSWLATHTSASDHDAARLTRVAGLCAAHPALEEVVVSGALPLGRADLLARAVTHDRATYLDASLPALIQLGTTTTDDDAFDTAVRYWADRVDERCRPHTGPAHRLYLTPKLFGGGRIDAELTDASFATVAAALDAYLQDPDPADAPYQRTLAERRADALDDLAHHGLTHHCDHDLDGDCPDPDEQDIRRDDTFDGHDQRDTLDEQLDAADTGDDADDADEPLDHLDALRRRLAHAETRRRRRAHRQVRARAGVTANIHLDLRALTNDRPLDAPDAFDHLVSRTDAWTLGRNAAERLLCDSNLVATLFAGPTHILDANPATPRFTTAQRRAIATRDQHCVFPSCRRPPRHCDTHHLHHHAHGGPSVVDNGALICRHHHRLIHEHAWTLHHDGTHWTATDPHGTEWKGRPTHHQPS